MTVAALPDSLAFPRAPGCALRSEATGGRSKSPEGRAGIEVIESTQPCIARFLVLRTTQHRLKCDFDSKRERGPSSNQAHSHNEDKQ